MIKLYTSYEKIPSEYKIINSVNSDFNVAITKNQLNKKDLELMLEIEGLKNIINSEYFESNTGIVPIESISTGLKSLLLIRWLKRNKKNEKICINITECGRNILDYVFSEIAESDFSVLLMHKNVLRLKDRVISVNDSCITKTSRTFLKALNEFN